MEIEIKKLTSKDEIELDTIAKWFDNWYEWQKPYWTYKRIKRRLTTITKTKGCYSIFVAICNGKVVGTIGSARYDDTKNTPQYYPWIVNGFVHQNSRKKGIYKKLLTEVEKHLKGLGYREIYIRTDWKNLYEKMGWTYLTDIELDYGVVERLYVKHINL